MVVFYIKISTGIFYYNNCDKCVVAVGVLYLVGALDFMVFMAVREQRDLSRELKKM